MTFYRLEYHWTLIKYRKYEYSSSFTIYSIEVIVLVQFSLIGSETPIVTMNHYQIVRVQNSNRGDVWCFRLPFQLTIHGTLVTSSWWWKGAIYTICHHRFDDSSFQWKLEIFSVENKPPALNSLMSKETLHIHVYFCSSDLGLNRWPWLWPFMTLNLTYWL